MRARGNPRDLQTRQSLAREAARVMLDGGIRDFALAKRKALERLHLPPTTPLPRNQEIEQALLEHQRLFGGTEQAHRLREQREAAVAAMREFAAFDPRLVGPVLSGSADRNCPVCLHLFADAAEEVEWRLLDLGIPHRNTEQRLRMSTGEFERVPGFGFLAAEIPVELLVFSGRTRRHTPLSPVDGKAMRRAALAEVNRLLAPAPGSG
jgi:hypothetical protein